jgi:hypothetical protein
MRLFAFVSAVAALVLPPSAFSQMQDTLNGSIAGLTLPLRLNTTLGPTVTHLSPGLYSFSLLDNSRQHSFHVSGPYERPGIATNTVNFGTAGPDGSDVAFASPSPQEWDNVLLEDGLYRWICDLHGDLMTGSVPVGNYVSAEVVGGRGTITSPAGIACTNKCGLGLPDGSPPVTLTATPAPGYEFLGWSGGPCSGPGPCTVIVNGLVEVRAAFRELPAPPPPPEEAASALLTEVKVGKASRARVVTLRLDVDAQTQVTAQLRRTRTILASARATLLPGKRAIKLRVPRSAKAGRATVRLSLRRTGSSRTFVVTRTVRLPGP